MYVVGVWEAGGGRRPRGPVPRVVTRGALSLVILLGVAGLASAAFGGTVGSYRDGRYATVVGQTDWYTCGPAAVATILHYYYGMDVTEADVLARAASIMAARGEDVTGGLSALSLVRAMEAYGVETVGYRLTVQAVAEYFGRGGLPVILHVTEPEHHYVVAVGMVGDWMLIADPSWGRRVERWSDFARAKRFSGVTLVPIPPKDRSISAVSRQQAALHWTAQRLGKLAAVGRRLP